MIRPLTLFFIHGKISKKSKIVYRVCNNHQQCYTLNHSTPNSEKQLLQQTIFKLTIKIINKELANLEQIAYWQDIAMQSNISDNTARKAAYAHYSELIKNQLITTTHSTPATKQTTKQTYPTSQIAQHTHPTKLSNEQLKTLTLITHLILRHSVTEHYIETLAKRSHISRNHNI